MGSYSVTCALSGLPIRAGDKVIGWKVAVSPFGVLGSSIAFIPTSIPVEGEYNDYGGIAIPDGTYGGKEVLEGDGMTAICHKELWDKQIKLFDHKDFAGKPCQSLKHHFKLVKAEYLKSLKSAIYLAECCKNNAEYWKLQSEPFEVAKAAFSSVKNNGVNFIWYLDGFFLGVRGKIDTSKMKWEESSKIRVEDSRGPFELFIYKLIIDGCPDETADMLEGMCKMYATEIFRNRPIMPSQMVRCVQYPEYQKEVTWLRAITRTGNKFLKIENERRKKSEAEDRADERKERKKARSKAR